MKVEAKEVEKINVALNSIDGWKVDRFDFWESAKGDVMATIRLRYSPKEKRQDKENGSAALSVELTK